MEFVSYSDLDQLPASAENLFASGAKESVFFSRPWFENLVRNHLTRKQNIQFIGVAEDNQLLALLVLNKAEGDHYESLPHLYSSLYTLLIAETDSQAILGCLVTGLKSLPVRSLTLSPVASDDKQIEALQYALEKAGFCCSRKFRFYNWKEDSKEKSFLDYFAQRPSRLRNTIHRKQRKLQREQGYDIRLYEQDDLEQGLNDFDRVQRVSWKANEQFADFVKGLAHSLAGVGWLRLAVMYVKSKPVAAQFWFVVHKKASIFKLSYDEGWKKYSPGSILLTYLMQHVIDVDAVEEIDFLTGNDAYKSDWMSDRRERWMLHCANTAWKESSNKSLYARVKQRLMPGRG